MSVDLGIALIGSIGLLASMFGVYAVVRLYARGKRIRRPESLGASGSYGLGPSGGWASVAAESGPDGSLGLVVSQGQAICPACCNMFDRSLEFCPYDANRLIAGSSSSPTRSGSMCTSCERSFESGVQFCMHDGTELMPGVMFQPMGNPEVLENTGVVAKICPECRDHFDLVATYCSHDGCQLVAIN